MRRKVPKAEKDTTSAPQPQMSFPITGITNQHKLYLSQEWIILTKAIKKYANAFKDSLKKKKKSLTSSPHIFRAEFASGFVFYFFIFPG